jgi:hypothetical protein
LYWIESVVEQLGYSFSKSRGALWSIPVGEVLCSINGELLLVNISLTLMGLRPYVLFDVIFKLIMHQVILSDAQHHPNVVLSAFIETSNSHSVLTSHLYSLDSMDSIEPSQVVPNDLPVQRSAVPSAIELL